MEKINQVMIYVKNLDECVRFWNEVVGFSIISEAPLMDGYKMVEIAPNKENETTMVLFDVEFIKKYSPEVTLGTPSLMFKTNDIETLFEKIKASNTNVGEMVEMGEKRVFNFSDFEGNYFAVTE